MSRSSRRRELDERAAADPGVEPTGKTTPLTGIRRTIARRMATAWEAPAFHLTVEVEMSAALSRKDRADDVSVTDVLLHSCARALHAHPSLNAHFADDAVTTFDQVDLGVAVATDAGLVVPVIHDAGSLDLVAVAAARRDVVGRARAGQLTRRDVTGGTFTVSNLGMLGVDRFDAILNAPQVAILAVGATRHRPVWDGGDPEWRPIAELTLTCDHRVVDGAVGAAFLTALRDDLQA